MRASLPLQRAATSHSNCFRSLLPQESHTHTAHQSGGLKGLLSVSREDGELPNWNRPTLHLIRRGAQVREGVGGTRLKSWQSKPGGTSFLMFSPASHNPLSSPPHNSTPPQPTAKKHPPPKQKTSIICNRSAGQRGLRVSGSCSLQTHTRAYTHPAWAF